MKKQDYSAFTGVRLLCLLLASFGCGESTQTLKHDMRAPTRNQSNWNWVHASHDDILSIINMGEQQTHQPLPDEYADLQVRAKYWVDKIDSTLRAKFPEKMRGVPTPNVMVIGEPSANAFVSAAFTCYDLPIRFQKSGPASKEGTFLHLSADGKSHQWPSQYTCLKGDVGSLRQALEDYNQQNQSCKYSFNGESIEASSSCPQSADMSNASSAAFVVIPRTADWIIIHSGLFTAMNKERAFVGVIAHELGHFYRSHSTSFSGQYGYFYTMHESNVTHKPVAEKRMQVLGDKVMKASRLMMSAPARVEGQALASELYFLAGSLAAQKCDLGFCPASCQDLKDLAVDEKYIADLGFFPFVKPKNSDAYLGFENLARSCLLQMSYGLESDISKADLLKLTYQPIWVPILSKLTLEGKKHLVKFLLNVSKKVELSFIEDGQSVYHALLSLTNEFFHEWDDAKRLVDQAHSIKLGQYTAEQEADEEAAEWLMLIGFDASAEVETFLTLAEHDDGTRMGGHIFSGVDCRKLYDNQWVNTHNELVFVPVGNYDEVHHSSCFRAFNVDREIKAHRYGTIRTEPVVSGKSWAALQNLANDYKENTMKRAGLTGATDTHLEHLNELKNHNMSSCPLSPL